MLQQLVMIHMYLCTLPYSIMYMYFVQFQIRELAHTIQDKFFSSSAEKTRKVTSELQSILAAIESVCLAHESDTVSSDCYICTCTVSLTTTVVWCVCMYMYINVLLTISIGPYLIY